MRNIYRHHLSNLNDLQQGIYAAIYKKLCSCRNTVKLPIAHPNEILLAFEAILLDNPEIFYVDSFQYISELNKAVALTPNYLFSASEIRRHQEAVQSSLAFTGAVGNKSDYEKVLYVHDAILNSVRYDYTFAGISNTVLGVAENKLGVCEGIAKYVKLALDCLSVKSIVVTGRATNPSLDRSVSEAHAWNMVEVDGNWHHLDVTFDLTLKHKTNRYDYFLISDEDIRVDHSTGNKLPSASVKQKDYYYLKGLAVAKSVNLEKLIYDGLVQGQRIMQFKLLNVREGLDPCDKVMQIAQAQCQSVLPNASSVELRYNSALWVFELEIT